MMQSLAELPSNKTESQERSRYQRSRSCANLWRLIKENEHENEDLRTRIEGIIEKLDATLINFETLANHSHESRSQPHDYDGLRLRQENESLKKRVKLLEQENAASRSSAYVEVKQLEKRHSDLLLEFDKLLKERNLLLEEQSKRNHPMVDTSNYANRCLRSKLTETKGSSSLEDGHSQVFNTEEYLTREGAITSEEDGSEVKTTRGPSEAWIALASGIFAQLIKTADMINFNTMRTSSTNNRLDTRKQKRRIMKSIKRAKKILKTEGKVEEKSTLSIIVCKWRSKLRSIRRLFRRSYIRERLKPGLHNDSDDQYQELMSTVAKSIEFHIRSPQRCSNVCLEVKSKKKSKDQSVCSIECPDWFVSLYNRVTEHLFLENEFPLTML